SENAPENPVQAAFEEEEEVDLPGAQTQSAEHVDLPAALIHDHHKGVDHHKTGEEQEHQIDKVIDVVADLEVDHHLTVLVPGDGDVAAFHTLRPQDLMDAFEQCGHIALTCGHQHEFRCRAGHSQCLLGHVQRHEDGAVVQV